MYAMLLGKLPFKVEHRSRNLAKLHACILKGCEIPNTLSRGRVQLYSHSMTQDDTIDRFRVSRFTLETVRTLPNETHYYARNSSSSIFNISIGSNRRVCL